MTRRRMRFRANGKNHDQYEMKAVDVMTGEVLHRALTDTLIRHKWPEEKPEKEKEYLIRAEFDNDAEPEDVYEVRMVAEWQEKQTDGEWYSQNFEPGFYTQDDNDMWYYINFVTHWWELPEVKE